MITADTITDEQIRELKRQTMESWLGRALRTSKKAEQYTLDVCDLALGLAQRLESTGLMQRAGARARCAEILNARAKDGAK